MLYKICSDSLKPTVTVYSTDFIIPEGVARMDTSKQVKSNCKARPLQQRDRAGNKSSPRRGQNRIEIRNLPRNQLLFSYSHHHLLLQPNPPSNPCSQSLTPILIGFVHIQMCRYVLQELQLLSIFCLVQLKVSPLKPYLAWDQVI